MGMSAAHCQGNVREFQCLESGHPVVTRLYMVAGVSQGKQFIVIFTVRAKPMFSTVAVAYLDREFL